MRRLSLLVLRLAPGCDVAGLPVADLEAASRISQADGETIAAGGSHTCAVSVGGHVDCEPAPAHRRERSANASPSPA